MFTVWGDRSKHQRLQFSSFLGAERGVQRTPSEKEQVREPWLAKVFYRSHRSTTRQLKDKGRSGQRGQGVQIHGDKAVQLVSLLVMAATQCRKVVRGCMKKVHTQETGSTLQQ